MTISISKKIFECRKAKGFTQEQLGTLLGVSSQAVSKWEKAESFPDITLLPMLCEALDITADSLLEVPSHVQKKNCMNSVFSLAQTAGEYCTAFDAICATSYLSARDNGGANMSAEGVKIHNTQGLGIVIAGREMMQKIKETDIESIQKMTNLVTNEDVMAVVRVLKSGTFMSEIEIAEKSGLKREAVQMALFKLLKHGICECDANENYVFGAKSYMLFGVLAGCYLASPEGYRDIGNLTCSYREQN